MLQLAPDDALVKAYLHDLQRLKGQQVTNELSVRGPFQTLLDKAARRRGWTLVPELSTYSGGRRVVPDGTVRDEYLLARGWWEAKDTSDRLAAEIHKKLKAGYPARNTIFEDTREAVLYQDGAEAGGVRRRRHYTSRWRRIRRALCSSEPVHLRCQYPHRALDDRACKRFAGTEPL